MVSAAQLLEHLTTAELLVEAAISSRDAGVLKKIGSAIALRDAVASVSVLIAMSQAERHQLSARLEEFDRKVGQQPGNESTFNIQGVRS